MAYRLKASDYVNNCPISDNAYFTFVKRIMAVVLGPNCELMLQTLNRYLEGDRLNYADLLDEHLRLTFEMLRFEIDKAIIRSTRARELARVRKRRPHSGKSKNTSASSLKKTEAVKAKNEKNNRPKSEIAEEEIPRAESANTEILKVEPVKTESIHNEKYQKARDIYVTGLNNETSFRHREYNDATLIDKIEIIPVTNPAPSRRLRRAAAHATKPRYKWQKIG